MTVPKAHPNWYGYTRGQCGAMLNSDTVCSVHDKHVADEQAAGETVRHRGYDPSGSGQWIEFDDDGNITAESAAKGKAPHDVHFHDIALDPHGLGTIESVTPPTDATAEAYADLYRLSDAVDPSKTREHFLLPDLRPDTRQHNHTPDQQCTFRCPAHYEGGTYVDETTTNRDVVEVYRDAGGDLRWRFKDAGNHEVMADGAQGYHDRRDVLNGIRRVTGRIPTVVGTKAALPNISAAQIAVVYV